MVLQKYISKGFTTAQARSFTAQQIILSKLVPCPIRICSKTIVTNNGIVKSKLRTEIMINDMIPKTQFRLSRKFIAKMREENKM